MAAMANPVIFVGLGWSARFVREKTKNSLSLLHGNSDTGRTPNAGTLEKLETALR